MFSDVISDTTVFKPCKFDIKIPAQDKLFSFARSNSHIKMGVFFEALTAGLFGGKLYDSIRRHEGPSNGQSYPDVWSKKRKIALESKACRMGHQLNLLDGQIEGYRKLQLYSRDTKIYFAI